MNFENFKQSYMNQKATAEGSLMAVEAEVKRLTAVVHHFGGAIAAINDLEQNEADELKRKLESHERLSEEDIQRALPDNQVEPAGPPPKSRPSREKGKKPRSRK